jgi:transposase-like protein
MMENGKSRSRRQLSPEEKWEIFLEVSSPKISQADAARKYGVDVSVIIRLRALAKDAALAAFASSKPGRPALVADAEVELLRAENERLSEALKEMANELTLLRGKAALGLFGPVGARVSAATKLELLGLIEGAVADGWAHTRACRVLELADVRAHRWHAKLARTGSLEDGRPGGRGGPPAAGLGRARDP